uniref:Uncharacterized protein n=1 Tax=Candidatus Methanogaster sp. ANME-2c ERB4 TaxID=2759911 RepID=A0A7G9Y1J2_9EURY|nr:hypothetical protein ELGCOBFC_00006 [Methanosarcinales archaeon ANME-2c ERB4]
MPGIVKAEIYFDGAYYCARTLNIADSDGFCGFFKGLQKKGLFILCALAPSRLSRSFDLTQCRKGAETQS